MFEDVHELNYSKIKTYLDCPALYKYKYVAGKREGLVPASSLGVSLHRTLELYHTYSNDPSEIFSYYDDAWLSAGYATAGEQMEWYLKGKRMLEVYAQREYERNSTVDSTEREFIFQEGKWTIRGKIDRTDKLPDGSWEIIDYKTGEDVDLSVPVADSLQLGIYAIGARRAWNIKQGKATFYFMAFDTCQSVPLEAFNEEKIIGTFLEIGQKIEAQQFEPCTSYCAKCLLRTSCEFSICKERAQ